VMWLGLLLLAARMLWGHRPHDFALADLILAERDQGRWIGHAASA
jgi:hypothetical protein